MASTLLTKKNQIKRSIRELNLSLDELNTVQDKYLEAFQEVMQEQEDIIAKKKEKERALLSWARKMEEDGITIDDILAIKQKNTTRKARVRYRLHDDDGNVVEWTGRGRKPKAIQAKLEQGHHLDEFKVTDEA